MEADGRLIPLQTNARGADLWSEAPMRCVAWMAIWILLWLSGCATAGGPSGPVPRAPAADVELGRASYYHSRFHGSRTASGERYDETTLTAAHRTLPFGTRVRVTNIDNGRSVVVTIVDRGPFARGRVIDVSRLAARKLGFLRDGTARVSLEILGR
jgi:rare lipoprotein A